MEPRAWMEQIASLDESVQAALAAFLTVIVQGSELNDGQGLMRRESELEAAAKRFLAQVLAEEVQQALDSEAMGNRQRELIGSWPKRLKFRGARQVRIRTLWGEALTVRCGYWGGKHRGAGGCTRVCSFWASMTGVRRRRAVRWHVWWWRWGPCARLRRSLSGVAYR